jgi:polygalacturonase
MTVQEQINAVAAAGGGEVLLPNGTHGTGQLIVPSSVHLRGSGWGTVVPPIICSTGARVYNVQISDLVVDGSLGAGYIGIDYRRVSTSRIINVQVKNVKTGILLHKEAYYNLLEHNFVEGSVDALEFYEGANQNTVIGGKYDAPICVQIINSNGNTFVGCALEGPAVNEFMKKIGETQGTTTLGVRCEKKNYGPVWI